MNMDTLAKLNRFATAVVDALNDNRVEQPTVDDIYAVLVVAGDKDKSIPPLGASLNFDKDSGLWTLNVEAQEAQPEPGDDDAHSLPSGLDS